jgi:hypothetical protein
MIVIDSKSGRRIGKIMFIGGSERTVLIGYAHYQNGRTIRTMGEDDKDDENNE